MTDLISNITAVLAVAPAVYSADKTDAPIVDLQGAASATVALTTGAIVSDGLFVASLVHGNDSGLSDSAAVSGDDLLGAFPAALEASKSYAVGYRGGKRFVRVVLSKTSGTSIAAAALVVKGDLELSGAV